MLLYQAIVTKYIGPTNRRGARIKATASAGSVTLPWDHALNSDDNHARAAKALADKLGWPGHWFAGGLPSGAGNAFVSVSNRTPGVSCQFMAAFTTTGERT